MTRIYPIEGNLRRVWADCACVRNPRLTTLETDVGDRTRRPSLALGVLDEIAEDDATEKSTLIYYWPQRCLTKVYRADCRLPPTFTAHNASSSSKKPKRKKGTSLKLGNLDNSSDDFSVFQSRSGQVQQPIFVRSSASSSPSKTPSPNMKPGSASSSSSSYPRWPVLCSPARCWQKQAGGRSSGEFFSMHPMMLTNRLMTLRF